MAATKRDRKPAGKKAAEKKAPEKKAAGEPSASHETPHGNATTVTYRITVPMDQAVLGTAVALAKAPVTIVRSVAPKAHGLPVYLGLGGLAVAGAVEWPIAAAAGAGFAALRRWGPLRTR